ncbi:MAG: hypothetical protein NT137_01110 [Methanomassiliicoccales archaeon]|nr:hypothetical protein [Methanomassiliicoccales archaeon]
MSAKKLFYFSAAYGAADRVLRLKYDRELLMMARVLQHTYDQFAARANGLASGEGIISITPDMLRRLADLTGSLASRIECNEEINPVFLEMVKLAYRTTGAGYYMSVTGALD